MLYTNNSVWKVKVFRREGEEREREKGNKPPKVLATPTMWGRGEGNYCF